MQYTAGTIAVTNGDATVVGTGTQWGTEISAGDMLFISSLGIHYEVASVTDDTNLELTANFSGATDSGLEYIISRDFTPNYDLLEVHIGDKGWPENLTLALRKIDIVLQDLEDRITALETP